MVLLISRQLLSCCPRDESRHRQPRRNCAAVRYLHWVSARDAPHPRHLPSSRVPVRGGRL